MAEDAIPTVEAWPSRSTAGFLVRTPYREAFVEDLKTHVPTLDRFWKADARAWWVHADQRELLHRLLLEHFDGYGVLDPDTSAIHYVDSNAAAARQGGIL